MRRTRTAAGAFCLVAALLASAAPAGAVAWNPMPAADQVAPIIVSGTPPIFAPGRPATFQITALGFPAPSISEEGTLPDGLQFRDNGNGSATISGTPTQASAPALVRITASNGVGLDARQPLFVDVGCGVGGPVGPPVLPISPHASRDPRLRACTRGPAIMTLEDGGLEYRCVLYQPCSYQYLLVIGGGLEVPVGKLPSFESGGGFEPVPNPWSATTYQLVGTPNDPRDVGRAFKLTLSTTKSAVLGYAATATITLRIIGPYLALGDSYSSGEGNPPYDVTSPDPTDTMPGSGDMQRCHRSTTGSWSSLAASSIGADRPFNVANWGPVYSFGGGRSRINLACSGAIIRHFTTSWPDNAQFAQISDISKYHPSLVSLSIGGNSFASQPAGDLGFSDLVKVCLLPLFSFEIRGHAFSCKAHDVPPVPPVPRTKHFPGLPGKPGCHADGALDVADGLITGSRTSFTANDCVVVGGLASLPTRLAAAYSAVAKAATRANKESKVVVMGYPSIVPASPIGSQLELGCPTLANDPAIVRSMREITSHLDATIGGQARSAGFGYVSMARGQFDGHELCSGPDSWLVPVVNPFDIQTGAHPNAGGQRAMAQDFVLGANSWIRAVVG